MNPDLTAAQYLKQLLEELVIEYPDGDIGRIERVDIGYISTPDAYPYATIHSTKSSAPVVRLGQGAGMLARRFEIDLVLTVEYEDPDPRRGYERLTTLRWEIFRHLAMNATKIPGVEFAQLDDALLDAITEDDGDAPRWGFYGSIIIPIKAILKPKG